MSFYQSIADQYEDIFPLNNMQIEFVKNSFKNEKDLSLLDIGCGTGGLSIELGKIFSKVVAIDLNEAMIKKALDKTRSLI